MSHYNLNLTYINKNIEVLPSFLKEENYETLMEMWKVYNPLTGPIQKMVSYYGSRGGCPVHIGHSEYYDMDYILRKITGISSMKVEMKSTLFAGGKGATLSDMLVGTIGESIERVVGSLTYFDWKEEIIYGTYSSLISQGINCISPEELHLFHENQYNQKDFLYTRFTKDSFLGWIKGKKLISGEEIYLPVQLVMLFYSAHPKEDIIGYATSGGLDSHINEYEAIYHGICELVERDAINLRWQCKIPLARIKINHNEISSRELLNLFEIIDKFPSNIDFYYHSLDIKEIAVITAIEIDRWFKRWAYYPGGGADIDVEKALIKALNEFTQAERSLKLALLIPSSGYAFAVSRMFDIGPNDPVSKINIFFKVVAFYGYRKNMDKLKWYLEGKDEIYLKSIPSANFKDSKEKCDFILKVMKNYGIDPIFFDFTPSFFQKIKLVKVFIPELTLPFLPLYPYLGHPRFYEIPQRLGITDKKLTFGDLIKYPLPYP